MVMEIIPFAASAGGSALRMLRCRTRSNREILRPSSFPLPVQRHLPVPCCRLLLIGVGRSWGTSRLSPLHFRPRLLHGESFAGCRAHGDHAHHHDEHIHDSHRRPHHQHHHHHHHHHEGAAGEPTAAEQAVLQFATAVGWVRLADFLREHLQLCCSSMALLLAAATSPYLLPRPTVKPFQDATILLAFLLVGISSALDAVLNISAGRVNIHVLMALAAFASVFMGNALEGGLLLAMFNLAHIAEEYFTSRAMIDVKELKDNHPEFALVLEANGDVHPQFSELKYTKIPVRDIKVGSYLLVRAGEAVPMDGEVYQGASTVTIEHLTGEAKPLERKVGDRIPGGARNLEGMMIIKSTKAWKDSTLSKIMQLTEEGQLNKPKLQRWLDEFGEQYSKVVVALSIAVALLGPFLFKWPFIGTAVNRGSIYRALGLMVAASPCALAVAPLAYATAISACASKGILLKGGHVLDALASCRTIAFDKTGTLTTGKLLCKAIEPIHGHSVLDNSSRVSACCTPNCENEALAVAAAMEKGTTHPIGRAVVDHSLGKDLPIVSVESFECLPGRGLFATLTGIKPGDGGSEYSKASIGSVEYIASLCKSDDESEKIKDAARMSVYGTNFVQAALSVDEKGYIFEVPLQACTSRTLFMGRRDLMSSRPLLSSRRLLLNFFCLAFGVGWRPCRRYEPPLFINFRGLEICEAHIFALLELSLSCFPGSLHDHGIFFRVDLSPLYEGFDPISDNRTFVRGMQQHGMVPTIHGMIYLPLCVCRRWLVRHYAALLQELFENLPDISSCKAILVGDSPSWIP